MARSLLGKCALFVALGLADLALTSYLLQTSAGRVYEGNPVAHWWLAHWGWVGLAGFKLATVLLVVLVVRVVARSRPRAAANLLSFACAVTALVLGYSGFLLASTRGQERPWPLRKAAALRAEARVLDAQVRQLRDYERCVDQLAEALIAGQYGLEEAVARLAATEWAQNPSWRYSLRTIHPDRTDAEWLASLLLDHVRLLQRDRPQDQGAAPPEPRSEMAEGISSEE